MSKHLSTRLVSLILAVALLVGIAVPVSAVGDAGSVTWTKVENSEVSANALSPVEAISEDVSPYEDTEMVRVSIVLEEKSTVEAGYTTQGIAQNTEAMSYRAALQDRQETVTAAIEKKMGGELDVVWNLTLAANIISANVEYGQIEAIEQVPGVQEVLIETRYEPMVMDETEPADPLMATSSAQIGSTVAWAAGYTGAGTRIAIIDTGTAENHQSFDAGAFEYSLAHQAGLAGQSVEDYLAELDLLDAEEIAAVAEQLNAASGALDAEEVYVNSKIPFGYNYVDRNYDSTHLKDYMGDHGSHVSGIAAANAYIPNGDGTYASALNTVCVQGVAPDAQIITMKVFGYRGGAYDSDYTAAIEDAIILGCDAVNLSLGASNPGPSRDPNFKYQDILDNLAKSGTVVAIAAGNSGYWVETAYTGGYLYHSDVSFQTTGTPGSYTNSLGVASVDNDGTTGHYVSVGDVTAVYFESDYKNEPMTTIAGEHEYVLIDGIGTAEDWAAIGDALTGKIALCSRGVTPFYEKANLAAEAGALALIVYNNMAGVLGMDLTDYKYAAPVVSISQADAAAIKTASEAVTDEAGNTLYYTGTMTVNEGMAASQYGSDYYTMSSFSSWGVPGSLELKPEITAPGGSIYSVYGQTRSSGGGPDTYKVNSGTSMAAPQVTGMAALVAQYIQAQGLEEKTGLTARQLAQSLLMSTAVPIVDGNSGCYYPVFQQGAGLANVGLSISADTYVLMDENATASYADGKVKVELGDDPERTGVYNFSFTLNNLTSVDKAYTLSADLFTQDVFRYYANGNMSEDEMTYYLDTFCDTLASVATFTVDGKELGTAGDVTGLDFNGDGAVNTADGQRLLDYASGVVSELSNSDKADLDADGDIDTHDAYIFFTRIENALVVPADGSVNVTVTVELTEDQKTFLNEYYPNGAYVEGYVFARGAATAEGVLGTEHSIPVLGFYGNWSDPSMYDVGSRMEYLYEQEVRVPYLGNLDTNYFTVSYPDEPDTRYYFGGNPLIPDETYMPERNAINTSSELNGVKFSVIRNAIASRVIAKNETTGEILNEMLPGAFNAAYYNINTGRWANTSYSQTIKVPMENVSEGDRLTVSLTLAPEYYLSYVPRVNEAGEPEVDQNGNVICDQVVDWDALGNGTTMSIPAVVDNTAPELIDIEVSAINNVMTVTASDNQYIAAVTLYNKAGTRLYSYAGAKQDIQPGETAEFELDLSGVSGKRFLVQVTDYAMNTTTYLLEMQIGEVEALPAMILFDRTYNYWTTFDKDDVFVYEDGNPEYSPTTLEFYAAAIVDHMVLASTAEGDLYIMPEDDLMKETFVRNMGVVLTDMAYNKVDKKIYGVADGMLYTVDRSTGALTEVGAIGVDTLTLACDANGTFYCHENNDQGAVYSFTLETMAEPTCLLEGITIEKYGWGTIRATGVQSMEIDPNTGLLCWASYIPRGWMSFLIEIDTETGAYTVYQDRWDNFTCLIFPESSAGGGDWTSPTDEVAEVTISATSLDLLKRGEAVLEANVLPWNVTDRTVTWSSSNEAVATVDQTGKVTAVADGTAVITVTSNLDPSVSASCTVSVESLDVTIEGILQDAEGKAQFYKWDLKNADTWTGGTAISTIFTSAAYNSADDVYYVMDSEDNSWLIHEMGEDGVTDRSGTNTTGAPLWDMTYSTYFSEVRGYDVVHGIFKYYLYASKDPMNLDTTSRFNLVSSVSLLTGIVSLGYEEYWDENNHVMRDTEHVILLDKKGKVWNLWIYDDVTLGGQKALYTSNPSDLPCKFPGDNSGKHMYSSLTVGDDGTLYVSAYNGTTNELYRLVFDETSQTYHADRVCDFGEGVWPASITSVTSNTAAGAAAATPRATGVLEAETVPAEELLDETAPWTEETEEEDLRKEIEAAKAAAEFQPASDSTVETGEKTVTLNITTDVAATNGLTSVTYDASKLALETVDVSGSYSTKLEENGKLTFAYVAMTEIPAEGTIATLTFKVLSAEDSTVTVEHKQVNNTAGTTETLTVEFEHSNTEVRNAIEATCTTAGYSGDTWCLDCGRMIAKGTIVEALGHTEEVTGAIEATCTEDGYTGDTYCTDCGELIAKGEVIPATGHSFGEWTVSVEADCINEGEEIRTCAVCGETETRVTEKRTECPSDAFTDLDKSQWYHEGVDFVLDNGLMKGMSDTIFAPNGQVTRAQLVTILYRLEGQPSVEGMENPFEDVAEDTWYTDAVIWAANAGVVNGTSETTFDPNAAITREQIAAILFRYAGAEAVEEDHLKDFADADKISAYALDAMNWAVSEGLITGMGDGTVAPRATATRAQIATILMRYCAE